MATTPAALSAADARKLGQWAKNTHNQSLTWLRGYLFAVAAVPLPLPAHRILTAMNADELKPVLEQQYVVLMSEIIDRKPKLPSGCSLQEDFRDNFLPGTPLCDWSRGFDDGMGMIFSCWEELIPQLDETLTEELDACWSMLSFFADMQEALEMMQHSQQSLEDVCHQVRKDFPRILKAYAEICTDIRDAIAEDNELITRAIAALPETLPPLAAIGSGAEHEQQMGALEALWEQAMDSESLDSRQALLEKALKQAREELGEAFFEEHQGHFWGLLETRPYMQALALLTECYQMQGELELAISHAEQALQLCPSDNLGLRYPLIGMLLETRQYIRVHALMEQYDESSVFFHYTRALLGFIEQRGSLKATTARKRAVKANPHFARLLSKKAPLPEERAPYYSPGDESEAVMLLEFMGNAWYSTEGAVSWLCRKN